MNQTEVHRIERELVYSGVSEKALLHKFRSASRGDVKLACALRGYFAEGDNFYLPYLQSRIRPAISELVLSGRVMELAKLEQLGWFTAALTDEFLELAISACVPESVIWLLKMKERRFGFRNQELTL